jgi:hypothetical protein
LTFNQQFAFDSDLHGDTVFVVRFRTSESPAIRQLVWAYRASVLFDVKDLWDDRENRWRNR